MDDDRDGQVEVQETKEVRIIYKKKTKKNCLNFNSNA